MQTQSNRPENQIEISYTSIHAHSLLWTTAKNEIRTNDVVQQKQTITVSLLSEQLDVPK